MLRCFALLSFASLAFAQTPDAVLTQTLINEIRALRQDLEATNVTSQRVQIALYRLQSQTAIVNTAQQRIDAARARLTETSSVRKNLAMQVQMAEDSLRNATDEKQKKALADEIPRVKNGMEMLATEEAVRQSAVVDAESQFRAEQARLADLQSLLDRLDKALDELARPKR